MRIVASRLKYLAFGSLVLALGACFFDPKATGPGSQGNPQVQPEGGTPLVDGATGATSGTGGQSGDGIGTGVGGMSVAGAGTSASTSGTGGMGGNGGAPPPPLLADGEECAEDARCKSGHCDHVCCEKGSECCTSVADCTTQGGLGMSCDDRSMCRGSAGKIMCTSEFKCVTINGARNDTACSNRVEANDCGLYPSVFCLGGELQQGAPPCATSCANDSECDREAHCANGACESDKPNGERCTRNEDCAAGFCKNMVNGEGICCGLLGDCCATPDDCPATYRKEATCNDPMSCRGTATMPMCVANICSMMMVRADNGCDGKPGPTCGLYQDITCMADRPNACRTSCTTMGHCDANAYCDGRACQAKKPNGQSCAMNVECTSNHCGNGVCCSQGGECCKTPNDCTMHLEAACDQDPEQCQGSIREPMCENSVCRYGERVPDDRACTGKGNSCSNLRDISCTGMPVQNPTCLTTCTSNDQCDPGLVCVQIEDGSRNCRPPGTGGSSGGPGPGSGNGNNGNGPGGGN
jgi:hypothetical protein